MALTVGGSAPPSRSDFIRHFVRDAFGSWLCIEPAEIRVHDSIVRIAPGTRLTRGTAFGDVELVRVLDEEYRRASR
jgi:hypothetical protein